MSLEISEIQKVYDQLGIKSTGEQLSSEMEPARQCSVPYPTAFNDTKLIYQSHT